MTTKHVINKEYINPVGKSVARIDGRGIVTGQIKYAFDVSFPNMLIGKMIRSTVPHAKILDIDISEAEKLPGVKAIVTAKDTHNIKYHDNRTRAKIILNGFYEENRKISLAKEMFKGGLFHNDHTSQLLDDDI